jgi:formate dehydrogenase subunit gamma
MTITHGPITPPLGQDAVPPGDDWVPRFGVTERLAHWWTMLMMASALLTGAGLGDDAGGPLLIAHVIAVALIGVGLVAAVLLGDRRALLRAARRLFSFDERDAAWLQGRLRHPLSRDIHREWGMFNTGQKLLAWALSVSVAVVVVTGIQSWSAGGEGGSHDTAIFVCMVLLGAHIFMAVVNPTTRPALAGMVFGRVPRSWAASHHAAWLKDDDR